MDIMDIMDRMDEHMMPAAVADPRKDLDMLAMIFVQVQVSQNHQQITSSEQRLDHLALTCRTQHSTL